MVSPLVSLCSNHSTLTVCCSTLIPVTQASWILPSDLLMSTLTPASTPPKTRAKSSFITDLSWTIWKILQFKMYDSNRDTTKLDTPIMDFLTEGVTGAGLTVTGSALCVLLRWVGAGVKLSTSLCTSNSTLTRLWFELESQY